MTHQNKKNPRGYEAQRKGLLAKAHIALGQLGIGDREYRAILDVMFSTKSYKIASAAALSVAELEKLVNYFKSRGFVEMKKGMKKENQAAALRERIRSIAAEIDNGGRRLRGLCRSMFDIEDIAWVTDPEKLLRLLAAITKIKEGNGYE